MSIVDTLYDQRGIQVLDFDLNNAALMPGKGAVLAHTNGSLYCVFAQNSLNAVSERRLFLSTSSDLGITWNAPVPLTSGYWDDEPALIQLDLADTGSWIGVVFNRAAHPYIDSGIGGNFYIYRFAMTVGGSIMSPIDAVDPNLNSNFAFLSLNKNTTEFVITALKDATSLWLWENPIFLSNDWVARTIATPFGYPDKQWYSCRVRKLANGHFALIGAVRTNLDGNSSVWPMGGMWNVPKNSIQTNIWAAFSDNDMASFGTPQQLTTFNDALDAEPDNTIQSALDADLVELSNGSIQVFYQGAKPYHLIDYYTNPSILAAGGTNTVSNVIYDETNNRLFVAVYQQSGGTYGGLYILDFDDNSETRLYQGSVPAYLWSSSVQRVALSPNGRWLAVATDQGMEIFDTTSNTNPLDWSWTPLRTTSTPALKGTSVGWLTFLSNTELVFAYTSGAASHIWGGTLDPTNIAGGITDINTSNIYASTLYVTRDQFPHVDGTDITCYQYNYLYKIDTVNHNGKYLSTMGSTIYGMGYDSVNGEYLISDYSGGYRMHRVIDSGAAFAIAESWTNATNPTVPQNPNYFVEAGGGLRINGNSGYGAGILEIFYSYAQKKPLGPLTAYHQGQLALFAPNGYYRHSTPIKSNVWEMRVLTDRILFFPITETGRLRRGLFTYNSGSLNLTSLDNNWYDVVNVVKTGAETYNKLSHIALCCAADDTIVLYGLLLDPTSSARPYSNLLGRIQPNAQPLTMRVRIIRTYERTEQSRARILRVPTQELGIRANIHILRCLQIRANIVPRGYWELGIRARIRGTQTQSYLFQFQTRSAQRTAFTGQFIMGKGQVQNMSFSAQARIAAVMTARFTGYFIIRDNPPTGNVVTFYSRVDPQKQSVLSMRANITR